jgi:hypothetical protein
MSTTIGEVQQTKQETLQTLRNRALKAYPYIPQEDHFLLGYFLFFMG